MSAAISHTAPFFPERQPEDAKLTKEEREAIQDDVYGRRNNNNNNIHGRPVFGGGRNDGNGGEEAGGGGDNNGNDNNNDDNNDDIITHELLEEFHSVLDNQPEEITDCLFQAMRECPDIVESESNPSTFLRCEENYNPNAAALRLCQYWNIRIEVFGKDRAFEPMTLEGAMNDVIPIMTQIPNFVRILPDDDHGRTVICFDRTNVKVKDYDNIVLVKCVWFVIHTALQRRSTQENGVVFFVISQSSSWDFPSRNTIRLVATSLYDAFPIKICCTQVCVSSLVATYVVPFFKFFMSQDMRCRLQVHNSLKQQSMLTKLESYGLRRDNLPKTVGGNYDVKSLWIIECERMLNERMRSHHRKRERERRRSVGYTDRP